MLEGEGRQIKGQEGANPSDWVIHVDVHMYTAYSLAVEEIACILRYLAVFLANTNSRQ